VSNDAGHSCKRRHSRLPLEVKRIAFTLRSAAVRDDCVPKRLRTRLDTIGGKAYHDDPPMIPLSRSSDRT
jgi:hypothetical protein